ncbi:hemolysin family protein [Microvirga aerilata]|uniref:hemolysin family protein n=1 Tax=Microvirga aerilata TaxID=670292 RepID=UPI003628B0F3
MLELTIVAVLIALNGLFSLSELAIVSSRKPRLKTMAEAGRAGARTALALAEEPGRFLSTVQIGITLVGILAGAFSGASLGGRLADILTSCGLSAGVAGPLGYGLVVAVITYLSVVIGELVPKHLALGNTEAIACAVAPLMAMASKVAAPVIWLLDASTRLVFRLLGKSAASDSAVTEEEIRTVVAEAETAGVIETDERKMISGVLRLGDKAVRGIMTPRTDVDWIDLADSESEIRDCLIRTSHSRLPVAEGSPDNVMGIVQARELLAASLSGKPSTSGPTSAKPLHPGYPRRPGCPPPAAGGRSADGSRARRVWTFRWPRHPRRHPRCHRGRVSLGRGQRGTRGRAARGWLLAFGRLDAG